ncbi:hypothetical protein J3R30DRAFT_3701016 [Lentinula aciculospora]|uniref:Uncharacterized protein n=1 Tax=Lentinula aciculospora TaxID=153920 RepID=A0A9W9DQJ9_9AGAR|nr:hypothetical protein J3R30DRAFT_3701016 [Lentinula aciculospora]
MSSNPIPTPMPIVASLRAKCTMCRVDADPGYKTCTGCRQKKSAYNKRHEQVRLARALTIVNGDVPSGKNIVGPSALKLKRKNMDEVDSNSERKSKRFKHFLKSYGLEEDKKREKASAHDPRIFGTEFQTAVEMYTHLKKLFRKSTRLNYKACHSIVADPECNHKKRAMLVAHDIQKVAHVPLEWVSSIPHMLNLTVIHLSHKVAVTVPTQSQTYHTLQFHCTCMSSNSSQKTQWPVLNRANVPGNDATSCQGEIEITVIDDLRHPLGIVGQQIRIEIRH